MTKILYRYEGYIPIAIKYPMELKVHRETKCMYVVYFGFTEYPKRKEKFIPKAGKKRFAYPTKEEAMVNYKARKRSQIDWSVMSIKQAEKGLLNAGETVETVLKKKLQIEDMEVE